MLPAPHRRATGERIAGRPARSDLRRFGLPIATSSWTRRCDDQLNPPWLPWSVWATRRKSAPGLAGAERHPERVEHEVGAHVAGELPPHHAAAEDVDHKREVADALPAARLGLITLGCSIAWEHRWLEASVARGATRCRSLTELLWALEAPGKP